MPIDKDVNNILDPILKTLDTRFKASIDGELTQIYLKGQAETISWGKTKGGIPITYEGPPMQGAIDWARDRGAELVTQMAEETKRRLAGVISNGITNKRGIPGIARDLRTTFDDMTTYRSKLIARTESANALSSASLNTMEDMGITGKEWVWNGGDCDICKDNQSAGVISVDKTFPSGHLSPPAHPNCECAIAPAMIKK